MEADLILLRRYAEDRDAEAFEELVRRHAGMVYAACKRVTGNGALAEDVSQECFMALAREAGRVRASLPGWLHRTAVHGALSALRQESRRKRREESMNRPSSKPADPTWSEVGPYVDEALATLPDGLREPLLLYFLEQRTKESIADDLGVNGSTVARRIDKGIGLLRGRLRKAGFTIPAALLATLFANHAVEAAPATLKAALGKLALAGVGGTTATAAGATAAGAGASASGMAAGAAVTTGGIAMGIGTKAAISVVAVAALTIGVVATREAFRQPERTAAQSEPAPITISTRPDSLIADLAGRFPRSDRDLMRRLEALDNESLEALRAFFEAYTLRPNETVSLVSPPFLTGRRVFLSVSGVEADAPVPDNLRFRWVSGKLDWIGSTQGLTRLRSHLGWLSGREGSQYVAGESALMNRPFPYDALVREEASLEERVSALGVELQRLRWPVRLGLRTVEREVIVLEGAFEYHPLPSKSDLDYPEVGLYGSIAPSDQRAISATSGGASFDFFLDAGLGDFIGMPVAADTVNDVPERLDWWRGELAEGDAPDLVLRHFSKQTGLTFHQTRRPVRMLFVEDINSPPVDDNAVGENVEGEQFLRRAIAAVFEQGDPQAIAPYFHADAEHKTGGIGSALASLARQPRDVLTRVRISETLFFTGEDLGALRERYPDDMWDPERIPAHMGDATGCVCVAELTGTDRVKLWVCLAKKIDGEYKIIYLDDN